MFQSGARWLWRIYRGISRSETWPGHPQPRQQRPGPGHKLKPRCQNHLLAFSIWVDKESENKFIDIYYTSSCFPSCNLDFSVFFKARKCRTQNTWPQQKCAVWLLFWSACLAVHCGQLQVAAPGGRPRRNLLLLRLGPPPPGRFV